jgi:magnesium chelatase subunit I
VWDVDLMDPVVEHFDTGGVLQISDGAGAEACLSGLRAVPGLQAALEDAGMFHADDMGLTVAAAELLLEGLAAHRKISRADTGTYSRARPERPKGKGKGGFSFGSSDLF